MVTHGTGMFDCLKQVVSYSTSASSGDHNRQVAALTD